MPEGMFLNSKHENLKKSIEDGYVVSANLLRYFGSRMAEKGGGQIVVIGSFQGLATGLPGYSLSSSSSHALWALCEGVRDELRSYNVVLSYFAALKFEASRDKKEYLTPKIENLFPVVAPSVQANSLMNGIANA